MGLHAADRCFLLMLACHLLAGWPGAAGLRMLAGPGAGGGFPREFPACTCPAPMLAGQAAPGRAAAVRAMGRLWSRARDRPPSARGWRCALSWAGYVAACVESLGHGGLGRLP
jgi:hypothetical protein